MGVARKRRTPEATRFVVIRSAHRGHLCDFDKEVDMVTTIGIDPHKATHTAVAIDEFETVLGELTIPAGRYQAKRLIGWASGLDGDGRLWAVESAGGLGYLLSQQLVAGGEHVVDVPAVLASRVRVLSSGRSNKNDPNDARAVAIAALRQPGLAVVEPEEPHRGVAYGGQTPPRAHLVADSGGVSAPRHVGGVATWGYGPSSLGDKRREDAQLAAAGHPDNATT